MENNNTIIFRMGEETGIVIEKTKEQFEHSLFREQYKQALSLVNSIISESKDADKDAPMSNIIAFCGDRGEGKTSALMTIRNILIGGDAYEESKDLFPKDNKIKENSFKVLNLVDPAFFDDKHNLLELLIGQMYADILKDDDEKANMKDDCTCGINLDIAKRNQLIQLFHDVHKSLSLIDKSSNKSAYDNLEEVADLAAAIELKEDLNKLMRCYAKYFGKDRVLISIDDLDLNVTEGYTMAEEIRKYLSSPFACVVLMSIKIEQMVEVVQSYLRERINKDIIPNEPIIEMAMRYVLKFIPENRRVIMPKGLGIVQQPLLIVDKKKEESYPSVKEAVVQLIYQKTRYIFVNGRNISPIVPTNLRSLRHLIDLLWELPDAKRDNEADNIENKTQFKNYFYQSWIRILDEENIKFVRELVNNEDISAINKFIIKKLKSFITSDLLLTNDDLLKSILDEGNQIQNISTGDVFYVLNHIEATNTDSKIADFMFFLKAYYSIKLYETYNFISRDLETLFIEPKTCLLPKTEKKKQGEVQQEAKQEVYIYKYDSQLRKLNLLQRLVNGAYFTYYPGDLIPREKGIEQRDIRRISGDKLREAFAKVKEKNVSEAERLAYLKVCEFFVLTTSRSWKTKEETLIFNRKQSGRAYFDVFTPSNNYFVFDVLSIFYNVVNIQMAYNRWDSIFKGDFFEYAYEKDKSLLRETLNLLNRKYKTPDSTLPNNIHHFISDAIIRFSELILSIIDNAINQRDVYSEGGNANNLRIFYDNIKKIGIRLYPLDPNDKKDKGHPIEFIFLDKIIELLNTISSTDNKLEDLQHGKSVKLKSEERILCQVFNEIFGKYTKESAVKIDSAKPISLDEIFAKSLAKRETRYPKTKGSVLAKLKAQDSKLYNANTEMWLQIIDNKEYKSWGELREELNKNYDEIVKLYQSINK